MRFRGFFSPKNRVIQLIILVLLFIFVSQAYADTNPSGMLDSIVDGYKTHSHGWESTLRQYATSLFWILAGIEFTWTGIRLALRGADFSEWLAELTNLVLFIGFFFSLVLYSSEWSQDIVKSFVTAGSMASSAAGGATGVTPSNIFDVGLNMGIAVMKTTSLWSPADSIGLMIAALIIVICFALIASAMVMALVEAYVVISASSLLMGFGGSRWTKDYALNTLRYVVSVGAKLFMMELIVGLGETMIMGWTDNFQMKTVDLFIMVGSAIVMLAIVKELPSFVQGMINGASVGQSGALTGAAAMTGAAAGAVVGSVAGATAAVSGATKLASLQKAAGMLPEGTGLLGATASNLKQSAMEDVGRRLGGRANHGTTGGRMADSLSQRAKEVQSEMEKPNENTGTSQQSGNAPSGEASNELVSRAENAATSAESSATRAESAVRTQQQSSSNVIR